jgi:hypothetical protein
VFADEVLGWGQITSSVVMTKVNVMLWKEH